MARKTLNVVEEAAASKAAQKEKPDQLARNVDAYARVMALCIEKARAITPGGCSEIDAEIAREDRIVTVATTMFQQFWSDQMEIKNHDKSPVADAMMRLANINPNQGAFGPYLG